MKAAMIAPIVDYDIYIFWLVLLVTRTLIASFKLEGLYKQCITMTINL